MRFIQLHSKNSAIIYKNTLCSFATVLVLVFLVLSVMIPIILVSLLSPYSGIAEQRILYEQPRIQYKFRHIFAAHVDTPNSLNNLVTCSTFANFNERMKDLTINCESVKYWTADMDYDGITDRLHFQQQINDLAGSVTSFDVILFFEAELKHKCKLRPPALLSHRLVIPTESQMDSGIIILKAELQLKQNTEFVCPYPGRSLQTQFRNVMPSSNSSVDMRDFQMETLLGKIKSNPAYFQLDVQEVYYKPDPEQRLQVQLEIDALQVPARYHLSVWERLGQFWLYFASFFGISFFVMNKIKDFLFERHVIRAWEIIPWKKLH